MYTTNFDTLQTFVLNNVTVTLSFHEKEDLHETVKTAEYEIMIQIGTAKPTLETYNCQSDKLARKRFAVLVRQFTNDYFKSTGL